MWLRGVKAELLHLNHSNLNDAGIIVLFTLLMTTQASSTLLMPLKIVLFCNCNVS